MADAASPSPMRLKPALEIPSIILGAIFLADSNASSVLFIRLTDTFTCPMPSIAGDNLMSFSKTKT